MNERERAEGGFSELQPQILRPHGSFSLERSLKLPSIPDTLQIVLIFLLS